MYSLFNVYSNCLFVSLLFIICVVVIVTLVSSNSSKLIIITVQGYLLARVIFGEFVCKKQLADFILVEFLQF